MIQVTLSYLILIYLLLMLAPVAGAWLMNAWSWHRRERAAFRDVVRCGVCAMEFADASKNSLPRCPHCGSLNERTH